MRITCGTSSPTYPIAPLTETANPVSTEAEMYTTSFTRVGTVGASTKTFTNTVSKGTYLYRVQAFNASGVSAYSNTITVRVAK